MRNANTSKTFWSVTYKLYGDNHSRALWFYTKEEAEQYAGNEHSQPIKHTYRNPFKIAEIEHIIDFEGGERL